MTLIDNLISFTEVKCATNKLKKEKHQASTEFPLKHSKQWTTSHDVPCIAMSVISLKERSTTKDGIKTNVSLCQSEVT